MSKLHQTETKKEEPFLPLVRLGLILPFVEELDRLGIPADAVLMRNGLVRATVCDPNVFVPAIVVHRFLEDAARAAEIGLARVIEARPRNPARLLVAGYSWRSASIGSSRAADRAGYMPKNTPTEPAKPNDRPIAHNGI